MDLFLIMIIITFVSFVLMFFGNYLKRKPKNKEMCDRCGLIKKWVYPCTFCDYDVCCMCCRELLEGVPYCSRMRLEE